MLILDRDITPANGPVPGTHYYEPWVTSVDGSVVGETFILAGWGQSGEVGIERDDSDQDRSMSVFHRGFNTVDRIRDNMIEYDLDDPDVAGSGAVYLESMGHYGDSGSGALYEESPGRYRIIGVKSNGSSTAYYGSNHEYTYVGDYHKTWIQANMDSIDQHVGAPNCGAPIENNPPIYGECVDTNYDANGNELGDSYGDPCSAYVGNTHWCGGYNTATFNSDMCCACGGGQTGGGGSTGGGEIDGAIVDQLLQQCADARAVAANLASGASSTLNSLYDERADLASLVFEVETVGAVAVEAEQSAQ